MREALTDAFADLLSDPEDPEMIWATLDRKHHYRDLQPGTFFNHFENHQELTTKDGLLRTLARCGDAPSFFPRCYDLGQPRQRDAFELHFRSCAALRIGRRHLHLRACAAGGGFSRSTGPPCCLDVLEAAIALLQSWPLGPGKSSASEELWRAILAYSELTPSALETGEAQQRAELEGLRWGDLSAAQAEALEAAVRAVERQGDPLQSLHSDRNVWIVKPRALSKGQAIRCMDSLSDILRHAVMWIDPVVQKYLERPLLLEGRKFDIRQWVLVRSVEPLKAFAFSECYMRLCQASFDLEDLRDEKRHLSNWSVNFSRGRAAEASVISLPEFKQRLAELTGCGGQWEARVQPQLERIAGASLRAAAPRPPHTRIVRATLAAAAPLMVQREGCFELYGFDFMLDEELNLWLLEVNSSPACDERTSFLHNMVRRMTRRMIEVVCFGKEEPDGQDLDWLPM